MAPAYQPDVVLLDIGMPGIDGFDVARQLRRQPCTGKMTLVALTGHSGEENRQQAQAAGFDQYMVKPVDFDALSKMLAALGPRTA